jgi:outer membrane immunogenic protein
MKKFLLAGTALLALSGAATAADLTYEPAPAPVEPIVTEAAFDWTGFYVGVHGGALFGDFTGDLDGLSGTGGLVGAQAGYNYQIDHWVIGVETDIAYSSLSDVADLDWLGKTTVRGGYAWDKFLVYAKGGVAYGDIKFADESQWNVGWTAGAGVEYAFTNNLTAKLEYNYVDLGEDDIGDLTPAVSGGATGSSVTAGLNFKF